jgi:hypothetical protein
VANYTVRVELHEGSGAAYEQLHKLMLYAGFARAIEDHDGEWWLLPTAEYLYVTDTRTCEQICELAKALADRVKPGAWVLVSQTTRRAWRTGGRGTRQPPINANEIQPPQAQAVPMLKFRTPRIEDGPLPDHA